MSRHANECREILITPLSGPLQSGHHGEGPEEEEDTFFEKDDQVVEEVGCSMSGFYRQEVIDVIQAFTRADGERREPIRSEDGDI